MINKFGGWWYPLHKSVFQEIMIETLCWFKKDDSDDEDKTETHIEMPNMTIPQLADDVPVTLQDYQRNIKIDTNPLYKIEEAVTTPNGTIIRRRRYKI